MTADTAQRMIKRPEPKLTFEAVKRAAHSRGPEILNALGLSAELLQPGYHHCPTCGKETLICRDARDGGWCCQKCQPTGIGDWFDFANWIKGPWTEKQQLEFIANAIGFTPATKPSNGKPTAPNVSSNGAAAARPNASSGTFEKYFKPINLPLPKLLEPLAKAKPPFTPQGLLAAGARRGVARFHPNCSELAVVGVPIYDPSSLEQIDWALKGADGQPLPVGKGEYAKVRLLEGREGVFLSQRSLELLKAAKPVEGLRVVKVEGLSDFVGLLSSIDEAAENLLIFSQAAGALSFSTAPAMSNRLMTLKPDAIYGIGDRDLAGQAGLIGGDTQTGGIPAGMGYANALAGSIPGPTFNVHLPYEIVDKKGKDVCDFLNDGHKASELFTLPMDKVAPCDVEEFQKRARTKTKPAGEGGFVDEITNFVLDDDERAIPIPLFEILDKIKDTFDGFPKRIGGSLFVRDGEQVFYLERVSSLFSWMRERSAVNWRQGPSLLSRDELFDALRRHAEEFDDVQTLPHLPEPIPGIFYTCSQPKPTDGSQLEKLLDYFSPATPEDRQLIKAAIVTLFWNGGPGQRAGLIFSADGGQGGGKTTAVHAIAKLAGGVIDFGQKAESDAIKTRLLSPGAAGKRAILIDNIKASRYSSGDFEALVTAPQISGKKMYEGEASRPNYYTAFLTMNSPSFSRDIAQRFINVVLSKPTYTGDWQRSIDRFIAEQRETLISDIAGFFQREPAQLTKLNRWGAWQSEVLARLDNADKVAAMIMAREEVNDADREAAADIEAAFRSNLKELGYEPSSAFAVHVPMKTIAEWISDALGEPYTGKLATMLLNRLIESGVLYCLSRNPSRNSGRGFIWRSPTGEGIPVDYGLEEKIKSAEEEKSRRYVQKTFYGRATASSDEKF